MKMKKFYEHFGGDTPLIVGSIRGVRLWDTKPFDAANNINYAAPNGLYSIAWDSSWTSGENVAVCQRAQPLFDNPEDEANFEKICKGSGGIFGGISDSDVYSLYIELVDKARKRGKNASLRTSNFSFASQHPVGKPIGSSECSCGFYAYTDKSHLSSPMTTLTYFGEEKPLPRIYGIIEGYGTVTVGDKGFRASKAKVVALIILPFTLVQIDGMQVGFGVKEISSEVVFPPVPAQFSDLPVFTSIESALAEFPVGDTVSL